MDTSLSKSRCPEIVPHVPFCWLKRIVLASKEKRAKGKFAPPLNKYLAWSSSWLQTFISQWSCQCHGARFLTEWSPYFFEFLRAKTTPLLFFFPRASFIVEPCMSLGECSLRVLLRNGILDTAFVAGSTGVFFSFRRICCSMKFQAT